MLEEKLNIFKIKYSLSTFDTLLKKQMEYKQSGRLGGNIKSSIYCRLRLMAHRASRGEVYGEDENKNWELAKDLDCR